MTWRYMKGPDEIVVEKKKSIGDAAAGLFHFLLFHSSIWHLEENTFQVPKLYKIGKAPTKLM